MKYMRKKRAPQKQTSTIIFLCWFCFCGVLFLLSSPIFYVKYEVCLINCSIIFFFYRKIDKRKEKEY